LNKTADHNVIAISTCSELLPHKYPTGTEPVPLKGNNAGQGRSARLGLKRRLDIRLQGKRPLAAAFQA
jgi:hypothetical protein